MWWEFVLKEMDSIYLTDTRSYGPREKQRVPRLPSEYASKQVWIGASFQARFEAEDAIAKEYSDRVIWGSDYPHFEGTYQYDATGPNGEPMTWASLRFTYAGLPADRVRAMLGGNAMNAYDLDYQPSRKWRPASMRRPTKISTLRRSRAAPKTVGIWLSGLSGSGTRAPESG